MGLLFITNLELHLQCFSNSDWVGFPNNQRSTNGWAIYLENNLIFWVAKKQPTTSRSSIESEYKVIANTSTEVVWLNSLICELSFPPKAPAIFWCDNVGAIYLMANLKFHACTKHIKLDYHFVRELVTSRVIKTGFISTKDQIADIITKPLTHTRFTQLQNLLRLTLLRKGLSGVLVNR